MNNNIGQPLFYLVVIVVLLILIGVNIFYRQVNADYVHQYGIPFTAYESRLVTVTDQVGSLTLHSTVQDGKIVWSGLLGNTLFAFGASFLIGRGVVGLRCRHKAISR